MKHKASNFLVNVGFPWPWRWLRPWAYNHRKLIHSIQALSLVWLIIQIWSPPWYERLMDKLVYSSEIREHAKHIGAGIEASTTCSICQDLASQSKENS